MEREGHAEERKEVRSAPASTAAPPPVRAPRGLLQVQRSSGNRAATAVARSLNAGTLGEMEHAFGLDFGGVRVHPDSPRAGGATHAVTQGEDVHFAPGRFAPGTGGGDRLIAHELAHVAQTRSGAPPASALAVEVDADLAADAAVAGRPAGVTVGASPAAAHAFEAWEHRSLGDAHGGSDRSVTLPNGITLTYGQVVALSGDFYRSPEALMKSSRSELEQILAVMDRESRQAREGGGAPGQDQVNQNNADYEMATTGHSRTGFNQGPLGGDANAPGGAHGEVREGEHVESGAPGAEAGFLDLAGANEAHFSPENIRLNFEPKHQLALDLARQAWQARHPGATPVGMSGGAVPAARTGNAPPPGAAAPVPAAGRPDPAASATAPGTASADVGADQAQQLEAQAWLSSAFSDHYLTDAFASGHLISGSLGRTVCADFYSSHNEALIAACTACAQADSGVSTLDALAMTEIVNGIVSSRRASLLLKVVHDRLNSGGVEVRNALGTAWRTLGDANLAHSPETRVQAGLASKASRDAVQDALATGGTTRALAALDYVPDVASFDGGPFMPIAQFALDPTVWQATLTRTTLSRDPNSNELYKLIKGNIVPQAAVMARKGARGAAQTARDWTDTVREAPSDFARWLDSGVRGIYGQ